MKFIPALLFGLACAPPVLAQSLPFDGRWLLDDGPAAAQAAYTRLTIGGGSMTWSGPFASAPPCVQEFTVKNEKPGTVYVDGRGTRFLAGVKGSIPTWLLQLRSSSCGRIGEETRIRYPLVYDTRHIEVIGYVNGKPVSSRRFRRKGERQTAR
jgi:hypothetical protein